MPRLSAGKRAELEAFWRAHLDDWSDLNQREYCELHWLPLKRFGNWRAKLKDEESVVSGKLLYRRGGLRHMSGHMSHGDVTQRSASSVPSSGSILLGGRRRFSKADKRRIVEKACRPGASVSGVARLYGITTRLLFRWRQELAPTEAPETAFPPVIVSDTPDQLAEVSLVQSEPAPVIVERPASRSS